MEDFDIRKAGSTHFFFQSRCAGTVQNPEEIMNCIELDPYSAVSQHFTSPLPIAGLALPHSDLPKKAICNHVTDYLFGYI